MQISAPSCIRRGLGPATKPRQFYAVIALGACLGLACSDDDPADQAGVAGATGSVEVDASVRDLPGDGREPTPDFDIASRQRTPIGPQRLVETIESLRDDVGLGADAPDTDAGSAEPGDGGAG